MITQLFSKRYHFIRINSRVRLIAAYGKFLIWFIVTRQLVAPVLAAVRYWLEWQWLTSPVGGHVPWLRQLGCVVVLSGLTAAEKTSLQVMVDAQPDIDV
jgi:hypothetical protein